MKKYLVVGLTDEEVGRGTLSSIMDVIRDEFMRTSQAVVKREIIPPVIKEQAEIRFENFLTGDSSKGKYKDYGEVLYLNAVARRLVEKKMIKLKALGEVDSVPKNAGYLISMPIYRQA